jgi:hypothetical protein
MDLIAKNPTRSHSELSSGVLLHGVHIYVRGALKEDFFFLIKVTHFVASLNRSTSAATQSIQDGVKFSSSTCIFFSLGTNLCWW